MKLSRWMTGVAVIVVSGIVLLQVLNRRDSGGAPDSGRVCAAAGADSSGGGSNFPAVARADAAVDASSSRTWQNAGTNQNAASPARPADEMGSVPVNAQSGAGKDVPAKANWNTDGPVDGLPGKDPYEGCEVVAERIGPVDGAGRYEWSRILKTDMKYPLIRVVDLMAKSDAGTGQPVPGGRRSPEDRRISRMEMVADHITVKLAPGRTESDLAVLSARHGAKILRKLRTGKNDTFLVQLTKVDLDAAPAAVEAFQKESGSVVSAGPDYIMHTCETIPGDPDFGKLWGMKNTGQYGAGKTTLLAGGAGQTSIPIVYSGVTAAGGVSGQLYFCKYGSAAADFPSTVSGYIALIERGGDGITFLTKVTNAKNAGAAAVIIFDNGGGGLENWTLGSMGNWLPALAVSGDVGLALKLLPAGTVVTVVASRGGDTGATVAWDGGTGSHSVLVGVIDTGVDYAHPDLVSNMWTNPWETGLDANGKDKRSNGIDDDGNGFVDDWRGWNFVADNNDPKDDVYHGTHCAGTIGASGNNGIGVAGVNWKVRMVALKFLAPTGGADSDAIEAIYYATSVGCRLTSNSWGGGGGGPLLKDAIDDAGSHGVLFVAAAGNSSSDSDAAPMYPAAFDCDSIISVAATDWRDQRAYFSNYGNTSVDLGAPGYLTYSTFPTYLTALMIQSGLPVNYGTISGTSMACPHVAGGCALLLSRNSALGMNTVKDLIYRTTEKVPGLAGITVTGGRLNIGAADEASRGSYPVFTGYALVEDGSGGTSGNGDKLVSPGERIGLRLSVKNVGLAGSSNLVATIAVADHYVTVAQGSVSYGNVASGTEVTDASPVLLNIAGNTPTPRSVSVVVTLSDSSGRQTKGQYSFTVYTGSVISGRVTLDGKPFEGVTVEHLGLLPGSVVTRPDGSYTLGLVNGSHTLIAKKAHAVDSMPVSVVTPPGMTGVDFAFTSATVSGMVTDLEGGAPIDGATVEYNSTGLSGLIITGSEGVGTNGSYAITFAFGQPKAIRLCVRKTGYVDANPVSVVVPPSAKVNLTLGRPVVTAGPGTLKVEGYLGDKITRTLTITNSGSLGSSWRIRSNQLEGKTQGTVLSTFKLASSDVHGRPSSLDDVINYPLDVAAEGSDLWFDNTAQGFSRIDPASRTVQEICKWGSAPGLRATDPAFICLGAGRTWLYARKSDGIRVYDRKNGRLVKSFSNPGSEVGGITSGAGALWVLQPIRAISATRETNIYKLDPESGAILRTLKVALPMTLDGVDLSVGAVFDLEYSGNSIWLSAGNFGQQQAGEVRPVGILRVSPDDGHVLGGFNGPGVTSLSAAGIGSDGGSGLWVSREDVFLGSVVEQKVRRFETAEADWLRESPEHGTVPAKSCAEVAVTLDTSKAGIGTHKLTIHVVSDDPANPGVDIPVEFIVTPDPRNRAPVVNAGSAAVPGFAKAGETVSFSVGTTDPDGDALTYSWDFADGACSAVQSSPLTSHIYTLPGSYPATVTVNDGKGGVTRSAVVVQVDGGVAYTITATAGNGGTITPSGTVPVTHGGSRSFMVNAAAGYGIVDVKLDGVSQGPKSPFILDEVTANHTVEAVFAAGADNPVLYWKFDESSGTNVVDASGNGNAGVLSAGMDINKNNIGFPQWTAGRTGGGLYFPGQYGQDARIANINGLPKGNVPHAICAWVKEESFWCRILQLGNPNGDPYAGNNIGNYRRNNWFIDKTTLFGWMVEQGPMVGVLLQNNWHHMVSSFDGQVMRGYLDGVPNKYVCEYVSGLAAPRDIIDGVYQTIDLQGGLNVGNRGYPWGAGISGFTDFKGAVDELKVFNRSLTEDEAASIAGKVPVRCLSIYLAGTGKGRVLVSPSVNNQPTDWALYPAKYIYHHGDTVQLTAVPESGCAFGGWTRNEAGSSNTLSLAMDVHKSVAAVFNRIQCTVSASAGSGGTISPAGTLAVAHGGMQTFGIAAAPGYVIADVTVDGVSVGAVAAYTLNNVTASRTIAATFKSVSTRSITASASGGGRISPAGAVTVSLGANQTFTMTPDAGYTLADVAVDGVSTGKQPSYTFVNVTSGHTIAATYQPLPDYVITARVVGEGGTISPSGSISIKSGTSRAFTFTPGQGYGVKDVLVDGVSIGRSTGYEFQRVTSSHTIEVTFTDGLLYHWKLDDGIGVVAVDSTFNGNLGVLQGVPSWTGGRLGGALALNGVADCVATSERIEGMNTDYSVALWFRTTRAGGKLIGFGDRRTGRSGSGWTGADRHIYMDANGGLVAGVISGANLGPRMAQSSGPWNDGVWHHAVMTVSSTGGNTQYPQVISLYVDGQLRSTAGLERPHEYAGYWRLGADSLSFWWPSPSEYFLGSLDDARVYGRVLSAQDALALYRATGNANHNPVITTFDPATPCTVPVGTNRIFSVSARDDDGDELVYSWKIDGTSAGGTGGSSRGYNPSAANEGNHSIECTVSDGNGGFAVQRWSVAVTIPDAPPGITRQPASIAATAGQVATFSVTASGGAPLSYRWRKNGVDIPGATASAYTTPAAVLADNGAKFTVVVSNSVGSIISSEATLTVTAGAGGGSAYVMSISLPGYARSEALTNFPVLVVLSNNVGSSGFAYRQMASANGYDLRFKNAAETQELNYEIESWNAAGVSHVWVQVPVLTNNAVIKAFWGDSALASSPAVYTTNGATWAPSYRGVWHMANGTGTNASDATTNNHSGTVNGPVWTNGPVGNALSFDGVNDTVSLGTELWDADTVGSVSAWVYPRASGGALLVATTQGNDNRLMRFCQNGFIQAFVNGSFNDAYQPTTALTLNQWHFITFTSQGSTWTFYDNGVARPLSMAAGSNAGKWFNSIASSGTQDYKMGELNTTYTDKMNGITDELRVESVLRSSNWVWACYLNQASNAVFCSFGAASGGNTAPTVATAAAAGPSTVTASTSALTVLGADDAGESALTYTWVTNGANPAAVSFAPNGNNAAKSSTATFIKAGTYSLKASIQDAGGLSTQSVVAVTVNQTLTTVTVSPLSAAVTNGNTQQFTASAMDQFGQAMSPSYTWSVSGGGSISAASGLFTATTAGGPFTVTATTAGRTGTASVTVTAVSAGQVAWWKFDETAGTIAADSSGGGHSATLQGGAVWTTGGNQGGALQLIDANDIAVVSPVVPLAANWTIAAWFTAPLPATATWHTLTRGQASAGGDHQIIADASLNLGMYDNATGSQFRGCGYNMGRLSAGWHHLTAVGSGTTTKFYIDGVLAGTSDRRGTGDVCYLGNCVGGGQRFSDKVDDVRVYNYALAQAEITALVGPVTNTPPRLLVYWKMDETTGTSASDSSGLTNNGVVAGGATWVAGRTNGAMKLDGVDDAVTLGGVRGLSTGSKAHTVAGWVKVDALPSNRAWILQMGNDGSGSHHWLIDKTGKTQFGVWNGAQLQPVLTVGRWTHVAITYDGTNVVGYLDGARFGSAVAGFNLQGVPMTIGKPRLNENAFNGMIDDVRVYGVALSASEVALLAGGTSVASLGVEEVLPAVTPVQAGALAQAGVKTEGVRTAEDTGFIMACQGVQDSSYVVEYSDDLLDPNGWRVLSTNICTASGTMEVVDPTGGANRFYRILQR